jgi:nucleotide-binding universal stress UspA family protein
MSVLVRSVQQLGEKAVKEAALLADKKGLRADTSVVSGSGRHASDVILEEARKWHADLIVMGTHGRRGFSRLLLGSDAERVLRDTPVPLLLIREFDAPPRRKRSPAKRG